MTTEKYPRFLYPKQSSEDERNKQIAEIQFRIQQLQKKDSELTFLEATRNSISYLLSFVKKRKNNIAHSNTEPDVANHDEAEEIAEGFNYIVRHWGNMSYEDYKKRDLQHEVVLEDNETEALQAVQIKSQRDTTTQNVSNPVSAKSEKFDPHAFFQDIVQESKIDIPNAIMNSYLQVLKKYHDAVCSIIDSVYTEECTGVCAAHMLDEARRDAEATIPHWYPIFNKEYDTLLYETLRKENQLMERIDTLRDK